MARRGRRVPPLLPSQTVHLPPTPTPPTLPPDWQLPPTEHDTLPAAAGGPPLDTGSLVHVVPLPLTQPIATKAAYQAALLEHTAFHKAVAEATYYAAFEGADTFEEPSLAYGVPLHIAPLLLAEPITLAPAAAYIWALPIRL